MARMMGKAHSKKGCPYECCLVDSRQRFGHGGRKNPNYTKSKRNKEKTSWRKAVDES